MRNKNKKPNIIRRVVVNFSPAAANITYEQSQRLAFNVLAPIVTKANKKGMTKLKTRYPLFGTQLQSDDGNVVLAFKTRWNEKTQDDVRIVNLNKEVNQKKGISPFLFLLSHGEFLYGPDWSDIQWVGLNNTPWIIFKKFVTRFAAEYFRLIAIHDQEDRFLSDKLVVQGDTSWVPFLSTKIPQSKEVSEQAFNEIEEQSHYFMDNPVYDNVS